MKTRLVNSLKELKAFPNLRDARREARRTVDSLWHRGVAVTFFSGTDGIRALVHRDTGAERHRITRLIRLEGFDPVKTISDRFL